MGLVCLPTWTVEFDGKSMGKYMVNIYKCPMDPVGMTLVRLRSATRWASTTYKWGYNSYGQWLMGVCLNPTYRSYNTIRGRLVKSNNSLDLKANSADLWFVGVDLDWTAEHVWWKKSHSQPPGIYKNLVSHGISYLLTDAGFLNHHQYYANFPLK